MVLTSKLIDGTFPDYAPRHPGRQRQGARRRQEGIRAGGRPRLDGVERARPRREAVAQPAGKLTLSVTNPDSGSATEELEVDYDSDPLDIGFNSRYLLDIAAQIEGEAAVLKLADPGSPTLIQDKDAQGRALRADADAGLTVRLHAPLIGVGGAAELAPVGATRLCIRLVVRNGPRNRSRRWPRTPPWRHLRVRDQLPRRMAHGLRCLHFMVSRGSGPVSSSPFSS